MKQKKKSGFFTFCFSLMPGAAEMYMGFMKMGFSIMAIFLAVLLIGVVLRLEEILLIIGVLIWFFAFFHARNVAGCDDSEFAKLEDRYIWDEFAGLRTGTSITSKSMKYIAYILVFAGVMLLWNYVEEIIYMVIPDDYWLSYNNTVQAVLNRVPRVATSVILIVIGAKLISGKKKDVEETENAVTVLENLDDTDNK